MMPRVYPATYQGGALTWEGEAPPAETTRVLVVVLPNDVNSLEDTERNEWLAASMSWLAAQYDDDEYEYTLDDIKIQ